MRLQMEKDNFRIILDIKEFIMSLEPLLENFPNKDKTYKEKIMATSLETLELIYFANLIKDSEYYKKKVISKLSMIDFYLEYAYKKRYLSEKVASNKSKEINNIIKMTYGWIKVTSVNSKMKNSKMVTKTSRSKDGSNT